MADDDDRGLLKSVLGLFARKAPESTAQPASLRSRTRDAWVRTDAFLQHDTDDFNEVDPESVARTLRAFEDYVECDYDQEMDYGFQAKTTYPKLRAVRQMVQRSDNALQSIPSNRVRVGKRSRESDTVIEELSHLDRESKRRRALHREEPATDITLEAPDANFAIVMRKDLVALDNALRRHWICSCQKCAGLSVRLSLPQRRTNAEPETSFEVFFGVRSLLTTALQEAKITVKDMRNIKMRSASAPDVNAVADFAPICQSITESLGQRNCLHLALEDGGFQRLRPQPKTFGGDQMSRAVPLSAFFERQQELTGRLQALPQKGKRILAVTLATALLPFLETPWLQPSFNHSRIHFFQPMQNEALPDITKPFLTMEHIPVTPAGKSDARDWTDKAKQAIHPNASVLALGILLCELEYCTPVELMQKDAPADRNVNTDYYASLDMLKTLDYDAGSNYFLATKACLQWEYYPPGENVEFASVSVQRLFYQNVIKRLESDIFNIWGLRIEDLASLSSRPGENEACWGGIGGEVIRRYIGAASASASTENAEARPVLRHSTSDVVSVGPTPFNAQGSPPASVQRPPGLPSLGHSSETSSQRPFFFDASHQPVGESDNQLSQRWMDNLLSVIRLYIDPFKNVEPQHETFKPVRIAILDSGFDPDHLLLRTGDQGEIDPRIKDARSFVHRSDPQDIRDEIGHGTHALGLLLNVATCAEIYVAKIAHQEVLGRESYDDIAKAINHAVSEWNVDIISMSFGIREYNEPMTEAILNASRSQSLLFAAASNDGANLGRAFPAKYPGVFCIHSTDGNGNFSSFNPTADDKDVNFSLLGEHVSSYWPAGKKGCLQPLNSQSGTSVATPIAAGLAASVLSFVRQQEQYNLPGSDSLGPWLKDSHSMDAVLKSMVKQRRTGYDYITPHLLFDPGSTKEHVYEKIKEIKRHMYD